MKDYELNYMKDGNVYIYGNFNASILSNVLEPLIGHIDSIKDKKSAAIIIHINSDGGEMKYLYPLIQLIEEAKQMDIIVKTVVDYAAYSCGSILAATGTKGHRYVSQFSQHILHLGQVQNMSMSTDLQVERNVKYVKSHFQNIKTLYKKYATVKDLDKHLKDDMYMLKGKEIIENGLADILI